VYLSLGSEPYDDDLTNVHLGPECAVCSYHYWTFSILSDQQHYMELLRNVERWKS